MQSQRILWGVDIQRDFMLPGGALYVPGAEKLIPNINSLVDLARSQSALLISSADQHTPGDPEFKVFPPHCVRGTPGAELIPEAALDKILRIPNDNSFALPADLFTHGQLLLEKQVLDVFSNPNTAKVVERLPADPEFYIFGVVTEYCVQCASKGLLDRKRRVAIVTDAIETLKKEEDEKTISQLVSSGARLVSTAEAISEFQSSTTAAAIYHEGH
ncbi:MAG TPA: isochorismatase family cysteine hydrolase [Terriglobales bacterium]|nr:isochorismatase family cysteine hydrolase [Terriglobales bacterium]